MNQFEKIVGCLPFPCDICGGIMLALPGGGWDNDRIICGDIRECGAEIVFPTSTELVNPAGAERT